MINNKIKNRIRRHARVRAKVSGTAARPRLSVFRSSRLLHLQAIDDTTGKTMFASVSKDPVAAGAEVAKKALAAGVKAMVFDRGGFAYHGRVKKAADTVREKGIKI